MKIEIGLLPKCLHGKAPRTLVSKKTWKNISDSVKRGETCVYCGSAERLHAHEKYRVDGSFVFLEDIVPVCENCHNVIHMGRMFAIGRGGEALARFAKMNGFSKARAQKEAEEAFASWACYPSEMFLDWSLFAERYGDFLTEAEKAASLLSKIRN